MKRVLVLALVIGYMRTKAVCFLVGVLVCFAPVCSFSGPVLQELHLVDDDYYLIDQAETVAVDGNRLAARGRSKIVVYDLDSGEKSVVSLPVEACEPSWKGSLALWGSFAIYGDRTDDRVCVVDITSGDEVLSLTGPAGFEFGTYLLVQGNILIVCSQPYPLPDEEFPDVFKRRGPGIVEAYDLESGKLLWRLDRPSAEFNDWGAVVVPQGTDHVVVGSYLGRWQESVGYMEWKDRTCFAVVESQTGAVESLVRMPSSWPEDSKFVSAVAANSQHLYLGAAKTDGFVAGRDGGVLKINPLSQVAEFADFESLGVYGVGSELVADDDFVYAASNGYIDISRNNLGDVLVLDADTLGEVDRLVIPEHWVSIDFVRFGRHVWLCDDFVIVHGMDWKNGIFFIYERLRTRTAAASWELFD